MSSTENSRFNDALNIMSFLIGLQNLEYNISQSDMDKQTQDINRAADDLVNNALAEIHLHLAEQDRKLSEILRKINENN